MGVVIYLFEGFAKVVVPLVIIYWMFRLFTNNNRNDEALMGAAYIVGFEVLSRMTDASFSYEFAKYSVMGFLVLGMFYRGFQRKSWPYILFLTLLIPGIFLAVININYEADIGNRVSFNLSGPVCLALSALYCYDRKMRFIRLQNIMLSMLLPMITMMTYLYLYTPDIRDSLTGTASNFAASGGFGPNQVATILGLGMFILFSRLLIINNKFINVVDLLLLGTMTYRAMVTFSRGGVITAAACAILFAFFYFKQLSAYKKAVLLPRMAIITGVLVVTWLVTAFFTSGLIVNRYSNQDAAGRLKTDITTGRTELLNSELSAFYENPVFGIGVGKIMEYRYERTGVLSATHNETSRMLSEHGTLGIICLLILLIAPLIYRVKNRSSVLLFSFLAFWFLTINHSSMRIAATAFVYGLCLITIIDANKKKRPLRRK